MADLEYEDSLLDDTFNSLSESSYDFIDDQSAIVNGEKQFDLADSIIWLPQNDAPASNSPAVSRCASSGHVEHGSNACPNADSDSPTFEAQLQLDGPRGLRELGQSPMSATNLIEISRPLRRIQDPGAEGASCVVSIHQSLSKTPMSCHQETFRVLFCGNKNDQDAILHKIASALAAYDPLSTPSLARSRPTRFNILPVTAFGKNENPEVVLIDSSGMGLEVTEVRAAAFTTALAGGESLDITLGDGTIVTSSHCSTDSQVSPGWKPPDLAILQHPESNNSQLDEKSRVVEHFLSRLGVNRLLIGSKVRDTGHFGHTGVDRALPHLCLKRGTSLIDPGKIERIPIDLESFLRLDSRELNRSLACIYKHQLSDKMADSSSICTQNSTKSYPKGWNEAVSVRQYGSYALASLLPLLIMTAFIILFSDCTVLSVGRGRSYLCHRSESISSELATHTRSHPSILGTEGPADACTTQHVHDIMKSTTIGSRSPEATVAVHGQDNHQQPVHHTVALELNPASENCHETRNLRLDVVKGDSALTTSISRLSNHLCSLQNKAEAIYARISIKTRSNLRQLVIGLSPGRLDFGPFDTSPRQRSSGHFLTRAKIALDELIQIHKDDGRKLMSRNIHVWAVRTCSKWICNCSLNLRKGLRVACGKVKDTADATGVTLWPSFFVRRKFLGWTTSSNKDPVSGGLRMYEMLQNRYLVAQDSIFRSLQKTALKKWWLLRTVSLAWKTPLK